MKRSTGVSDKGVARAMEHMVRQLGARGKRAWDLKQPSIDGTLSLGTLFDAYERNDLDGLRARMADVDLAPHVDASQLSLRDRVKADTAQHYLAQLRSPTPAGAAFFRSTFTKAPPAAAPRVVEIDLADVRRLVEYSR